MADTHTRCSICAHPDAPTINGALTLGFSYRWRSKRYAVSLGALSRHAKHRPTEATDEDGQPSLESRVGQLEGDVAVFRLLFGIGDAARRSWEEAAELECREGDGIPF